MTEMSAVAAALRAYRRASTTQIDSRGLLRRAETKFLTKPERIAPLLDSLASHYAIIAVGSDGLARYTSRYFDTVDLRCFHDHRRGRRVRYKLRLRSYADRALAFLEVKARRNELYTEKTRVAVPFGTTELDATMVGFFERACGLTAPKPSVDIDYRRITLIGLDVDERVTVDLGISVNGDSSGALGGVAIVEVKRPALAIASPIIAALRASSIRSSSCSKYLVAVAERTGLPVRRLAPALRRRRE